MEVFDLKFWAGTEESLLSFISSLDKLTPEVMAAQAAAYGAAEREEEVPRLYSRQGDVGVVSISGSLVNSTSWINQYLGYTGYPEIRAALIHAAKDPEVKAITLDIKSGGGAVSGVSDTSDLIRMIDKKVKPVYAYSDGMIASAAYWLGSSARSLSVGKVTEVGSIGVLLVHKEMSKYMEKEGITATVLRAGKYKAMGNPYEALSDSAREQIQGQLDQMYTMFVEHVADARGVTYAVADQKMAQGRIFIGQAAVDVGLADKQESFDAFLSGIQRGIDAKKSQPKYGANLSQGQPMPKNALTEQEIAALAAGAGAAAEQTPAAAAADTPAGEAGEAPAAGADAAPAAPAAPAEPAAPAAAAAPAAPSAAVDLLKEQLREANDRVLALSVELTGLKNAASTAEATISGLTATLEKMQPIVVSAVNNMRVALGGSAIAAGLAGEALLAEHASAHAQFVQKFKVGGVSSATAADAGKGGQKNVSHDSFRKARIDATRTK